MKHSRLAPSSAARWVRCPGSLKMEELATKGKPERPAGVAARSGTLMHTVFEECLNANAPANGYVGREEDGIVFDEEMAEWVQSAVDWVEAYLHQNKAHKPQGHTEQKLPVGSGLKLRRPSDCEGTADWVCLSDHELVVLDLKGGFVYVEVEDNYQLLLYTIGACYKYERDGKRISRIRLVIAQPRAGGNKELVIGRKELDSYASFFRKRAEATYERNAPLSASEEACQWCKAAGICSEAHKMTSQLAAKVDWPEPEAIQTLTEEKFHLLLENLGHIRKMCDRAEELAIERLINKEAVPGFKLVEGRSLRVWLDEVQAQKFLKTNGIPAFTQKLITPAAAERLLADPLPDKLTERPQGKPKLAPLLDARKEMVFDTVKENLVKSLAKGK